MRKIMMVSPKDYNFYNFRSELILELKNKGYDVILVCPYGKKIDYFTEKGCDFIELGIDRRGTNVINDAKLLLSYCKIFKREKPDLVLTYTTKSSVYSGIACRILRIPYIVNNAGLIETEKNQAILKKILEVLYRVGFGGSACMMYQNTKEKEMLNNLLKNRVHYRDIPGSGVNLNEFVYKAYPPEEIPITFNYVARIVSIKGIREFIECAIRIKKDYPNTRFVIYGEFDEVNYQSRIDELQKQGIVEYGGVQLDMKPCIEKAYAVIHASYYEGMTNVVLEHSAMGRVCIGSDIAGIREGIDTGVTGYTFEVKNVEQLVECVRTFINMPYEKKVEMGKAARNKMELEFDRTIVTNIYLEEIEKQLQGETL